MNIAEKYAGKWPGILKELGVPEACLSGRHGPCPLCDGKDRFRFDNREGRGTYFCSGCGPGDGPSLLTKLHGWDYGILVKEIARVEGEITDEPFQPKVDIDKRRRALNKLWADAKSRDSLLRYLSLRGIPHEAAEGIGSIRGTKKLWHAEEACFMEGMVSMIQKLDGTPVSLHRVYLLPGKRWVKKIMPPLETITGCAVRLGYPMTGQPLHIAEGIESALAVRAMTDCVEPVWATISAHGMENVEIPKQVEQVTIWGDHDDSYTGQAAAYALARRLTVKEGKRVWVRFPEKQGMDPLDSLLERRTDQALAALGRAS